MASPDIPDGRRSPSPMITPTLAIPPTSNSRYYPNSSSSSAESAGSSYRSASLGPSSSTSASSRDSSADFKGRPLSGSYTPRQSTNGLLRTTRRGFVRPQGTNFAASAQSRESVMSLGSIAHVQYYFARTGLLDGKGGQMAKKREKELRNLDNRFLSAMHIERGRNVSSASTSSSMSSPDLGPSGGDFVASPMSETHDGEEWEFYDDEDLNMLPPTVSTYQERPKTIPRPPTLAELKDDLKNALEDAAKALEDAKRTAPVPNLAPSTPVKTQNTSHLRSPSQVSAFDSPSRRRSESDATLLTGLGEGPAEPNQGWYELQGVHILDIITLAIRAARQYYTAHSNPERLSSIKSERKIRAELLGVMEVLRRMATRNFKGGMRREECETMSDWVKGCGRMLDKEEELEAAEAEERRSWTWLDDSLWPADDLEQPPNKERELAFLHSLDTVTPPLPSDLSSDFSSSPPKISHFLLALQNGLRLIQLHNAMVARSKRPFGSIPVFHTDTRKPYRRAENLRFWIKAAELRWEVRLEVDVGALVKGEEGGEVEQSVWEGFERAVWGWSRTVRREMMGDLKGEEAMESPKLVVEGES